MSKRKLIAPLVSLVLVCALVVTPVLAYSPFPMDANDPELQGALDYLSDVQATDGSIGSYGDSAWAVMAIAAAGGDPNSFGSPSVVNCILDNVDQLGSELNLGTLAGDLARAVMATAAAGEDPHVWGDPSVVDYLKDNAALLANEYNLATGYERVILAIVAACEDPSGFGEGDETYAPNGDYLSKLQELHNGEQFTDGFGSTDTLNDDFWGILALIATGDDPDSEMIQSCAAFIKANQDEDGGWSWATTDNFWYSCSDVDDTAAAIMALVAAGESPDSTAITDALDYLSMNQDDSGGFGFEDWETGELIVNSGSTSWVIDAIVVAGQDPTSEDWTIDDNPVNVLLTFQEDCGAFIWYSGCWQGCEAREKMTSYAISALLGKPYPVIPTCPFPLLVSIDIRPGTFPNAINLSSQGRIPVAILTTDCFDAATVDASTVLFGPDGAEAVHHALKDVDGDGDVDMILHFLTQDTGISAGDTEAILTGETLSGGKIVDTDSVRIVPVQ